MFQAAIKKNRRQYKELVDSRRGQVPHCVDDDSRTLLFFVADNGWIDLLKSMLALPAIVSNTGVVLGPGPCPGPLPLEAQTPLTHKAFQCPRKKEKQKAPLQTTATAFPRPLPVCPPPPHAPSESWMRSSRVL